MLGALLCLPAICAADTQKPPQSIAELQQEIEKVLRETGTPGAAVAIVSRDKVEWVAGFGLADVATNKPATSKTLFRVGSISKGFIALAALKLQEEGKLTLDDTVAKSLPECPLSNPWESSDPIRLAHLLEHTSGLPDFRAPAWLHSDPHPVTTNEALAFEPGNRYVRWRPGSRAAYSNYGSMIAAAVVEKAAGQRFEDYVRENFFIPLGMNTATYFRTPESAEMMTTTYKRDGRDSLPYWHIIYRPVGAISASAEDMAGYLHFFLQRGSLDGRQIVKPASIDRMEVPRTSPAAQAGVTIAYGLCSEAAYLRGYEEHGHSGGIEGALAFMGYLPELGVGRAIMINTHDSGAMSRIRRAVDNYLMRDVKPPETPIAAKVPEDLQRSLPGYYANIGPRGSSYLGLMEYSFRLRRVTVTADEMIWWVPLGSPAERWIPVSEKLFRQDKTTKPGLALIQGENGETLLQGNMRTYARVSAVRLWFVIGGLVISVLVMMSVFPFAIVWSLRKVLGRLPNPGPWSVRVFPLLGAAAFFGFIFLYRAAERGGVAILATPNFWTIGMMLTSLVIPLAAILSVIALWRHRCATMNRGTYWHSVLVALSLVFITSFSLSWGMIGLRFWV
jgi:CubicO group peptidase (beta-lactamase class C family)